MGRKNFVENYDPLRAHINRDQERVVHFVTPPEPAVRQALPTTVLKPSGEPQPAPNPEPHLEPEQATLETPKRKVGGGEGRLPQKKVAPVLMASSLESAEVSPRIKVTQAAFQDLETMLSNLHRSTGSQIHYSIATRALWGLLVQAEAQVMEELRKASLGRLPSTREKLAYAEYEERVKQAFAQAIRKMPRSIFQSASQVDAEAD